MHNIYCFIHNVDVFDCKCMCLACIIYIHTSCWCARLVARPWSPMLPSCWRHRSAGRCVNARLFNRLSWKEFIVMGMWCGGCRWTWHVDWHVYWLVAWHVHLLLEWLCDLYCLILYSDIKSQLCLTLITHVVWLWWALACGGCVLHALRSYSRGEMVMVMVMMMWGGDNASAYACVYM